MTLKKKIGFALVVAGTATCLTGIVGAACQYNDAHDCITSNDARYVQMVDNSRWQLEYAPVKELYDELKAKPEVQEAISNHDKIESKGNTIGYSLGFGGMALAIAGQIIFFSGNNSKKKEENKQ
ncbi:MAG: hypothetical protein WC852_03190 [Candidatus Nanoarchaeia archaeon]|jgi:hypothetical protein